MVCEQQEFPAGCAASAVDVSPLTDYHTVPKPHLKAQSSQIECTVLTTGFDGGLVFCSEKPQIPLAVF